MNLMINLGKSIDANSKHRKFKLSDFCPSFFWVLRDFSLDLKDQSANEYLESVLRAQKGEGQEVKNRNLVRQLIQQYFQHLECQ